MPDSLQPRGLQHARLPCPSLSLRVCSHSCLLSQRIANYPSHLLRPLLLSPSIFPSIRVFSNESARRTRWPNPSASILPMNIQDWFPLWLTGLISLVSKGLSRVNSSTKIRKHQLCVAQSPSQSNSHILTWPLEKPVFTIRTFVSKVMSLLYNTLSRRVIAFLLRRKCLLVLWLQSQFTVILESRKRKFVTSSTFYPSICHEWWDWMPWSLCFWCWVLSLIFHSSFSPSSRGSLFPSSSLTAVRVLSAAYLRLLIFLPTILILACDSSSQHFTWYALHVP